MNRLKMLSITPFAFNRRNTINDTMKYINLNDINYYSTVKKLLSSGQKRAENYQVSLKCLHQHPNGCIIAAAITNKGISVININS